MRKIEGTATISIEELDNLRQYEQWFNELRRDIRGLVKEIDTEQYEKEMEKIDDMGDISDREIHRLVKEAARTLKIIVSEKIVKKLVREYIDETKSDVHREVSEMDRKTLGQIPIFLEGKCEDCEIGKHIGYADQSGLSPAT